MGKGYFPGVKRPGRGADHPALLVLRSRKSRAIPLPPSGPSDLLRGTCTFFSRSSVSGSSSSSSGGSNRSSLGREQKLIMCESKLYLQVHPNVGNFTVQQRTSNLLCV